MPDMTGKVVLITGASSGIGLEAAVELAKQGAHVSVVARDRKKVDATVAEVQRRSGSQHVDGFTCEFGEQAQVRALAAAFREKHDRLDVLVNNAGAVYEKRTLTVDGIESTWAVNHLGYFLLTHELLPLLEKTGGARIVNTSSRSHYRGKIDLDDPGYEKGGYWITTAYARSKLANVLFTRELAKRYGSKGITANCLHPGVVATNIWTKAPFYARPFLWLYQKVVMISPAEGARPIVHLASSPDVAAKNGIYIHEDCKERIPSRRAQDDEMAAKLWEHSMKAVKIA